MTVAPDGAGYQNLAGATVTTQLHLVGQYTCDGCGITETAVTKQLDDTEGDYDFVRPPSPHRAPRHRQARHQPLGAPMFGRKKAAETRAEYQADYEAQAEDYASDVLDLTRDPAVRVITHHDGRVEYRRSDAD